MIYKEIKMDYDVLEDMEAREEVAEEMGYGKDEDEELKQCPYNKACKCIMDEPCEGCEEYGMYHTRDE